VYIKQVRWKIKPSFDGTATQSVVNVTKNTAITELPLKSALKVGWYFRDVTD